MLLPVKGLVAHPENKIRVIKRILNFYIDYIMDNKEPECQSFARSIFSYIIAVIHSLKANCPSGFVRRLKGAF